MRSRRLLFLAPLLLTAGAFRAAASPCHLNEIGVRFVDIPVEDPDFAILAKAYERSVLQAIPEACLSGEIPGADARPGITADLRQTYPFWGFSEEIDEQEAILSFAVVRGTAASQYLLRGELLSRETKRPACDKCQWDLEWLPLANESQRARKWPTNAGLIAYLCADTWDAFRRGPEHGTSIRNQLKAHVALGDGARWSDELSSAGNPAAGGRDLPTIGLPLPMADCRHYENSCFQVSCFPPGTGASRSDGRHRPRAGQHLISRGTGGAVAFRDGGERRQWLEVKPQFLTTSRARGTEPWARFEPRLRPDLRPDLFFLLYYDEPSLYLVEYDCEKLP